jgi:hypothetical protein
MDFTFFVTEAYGPLFTNSTCDCTYECNFTVSVAECFKEMYETLQKKISMKPLTDSEKIHIRDLVAKVIDDEKHNDVCFTWKEVAKYGKLVDNGLEEFIKNEYINIFRDIFFAIIDECDNNEDNDYCAIIDQVAQYRCIFEFSSSACYTALVKYFVEIVKKRLDDKTIG